MPLTGLYEPTTNQWIRDAVHAYETTDGEEGGTYRGSPVVILSYIGAKSGHIRKTPLIRFERNGQYALVASAAGARELPDWYWGVKRHLIVEVQDRAIRQEFLAHEATSAEYDNWWAFVQTQYGSFDEYVERIAGERTIPIFVLDKAGV